MRNGDESQVALREKIPQPAHRKPIEKSELEKLLAQGLTPSEIASQLGVSAPTVYTQIKAYGLKADQAARTQRRRRQQGFTERNLRNLYVEGGLSTREIARHYNIGRSTVQQLLAEFGIPRRKAKNQRPEKDALQTLYVDQQRTAREIGETFGVSATAVLRWLDDYGIKRRPCGTAAGRPRFTKEQLSAYRKLTIAEIARTLGVTRYTARYWLARYGIQAEGQRKPQKPRYTKSELYDLYMVKNWKLEEIARRYGTSKSTIGKWLARYGIRKMTDAKIEESKV